MVKCNCCGNIINPGTGKMFIKVDGKVFYFCNSKCERNIIKLKRKPYNLRWSKLYKKK